MRFSWTRRVVPVPEPIAAQQPTSFPGRSPQRANSDSALLPIASPAGRAAAAAAASPARAPPPSPGTPTDLECEELQVDHRDRPSSSTKPPHFFQGAAFAPKTPTRDSPGARVRSCMVAAGYRLDDPAPNARRARRRAPEEPEAPEFRARWQKAATLSKHRGAPAAPPSEEAADGGAGAPRPRPGRSASEPSLRPSRLREEEAAVPATVAGSPPREEEEDAPAARHQRKGTFFVAAAAAVVAAVL